MTSVYITNQQIQVVVGTASQSGIAVRRVMTEPLPEGCMLNGAIINPTEISQRLSALFKREKLSGNVHLVIDSSDVHTRVMETPILSERALREYLQIELQELDPMRDPLIDYMVLDPRTEAGGGLVLAAQMERTLVGDYLALFSEAKITVESIIPALAAVIDLAQHHKLLADDTCILSVFDGSMMTQILFVEGKYRFSKRIRLMNEFGTDALVEELERSFSSLLQFYRTEQRTTPLSSVYFCGFPGDVGAQFVRFLDTLGIRITALPEDAFVQTDNQCRLSDSLYVIGNLLAST